MHFLQTECAHKTRNKWINSKDHERNTACRPRVSGVHMRKSNVHLRTVYSFNNKYHKNIIGLNNVNRLTFGLYSAPSPLSPLICLDTSICLKVSVKGFDRTQKCFNFVSCDTQTIVLNYSIIFLTN